MSYKPDESALISYLYGELSDREREKVHRYLQEHPDALEDVREKSDVLSVLGTLRDKEVIAPSIVSEEQHRGVSFWQHGPFKTLLGIAASLLLIMIAGKLLGTELSYSNGELRIGFGGIRQSVVPPSASEVKDSFTRNDVQTMIDESLMHNNELVTADLSANQRKLDEAVHRVMNQNSKKINELMSQVSIASQNQIRDYAYNMQVENVRLMKDYMTLSATDQKQYMEDLLADFAGYLQKQREQDLVQLVDHVNNLEQNTDQFKLETEQILASIISGTTENSKNNY